MAGFFERLRRGLNDAQEAQNQALGSAQQLPNQQAPAVTSGIGGIGRIRDLGGSARSMEIPQERAIPGLPEPGTGFGRADYSSYNRWRKDRLDAARQESAQRAANAPSQRGLTPSVAEAARQPLPEEPFRGENPLRPLGGVARDPQNDLINRPRPVLEGAGRPVPGVSTPDQPLLISGRGSRAGSYSPSGVFLGPKAQDLRETSSFGDYQAAGAPDLRSRRYQAGIESALDKEIEARGGAELRRQLTNPEPATPGAYEAPLVPTTQGVTTGRARLAQSDSLRRDSGIDGGETYGGKSERANPPMTIRPNQTSRGAENREPVRPEPRYPASLLIRRGLAADKNPGMIDNPDTRWTNSGEDPVNAMVTVPYVDQRGRIVERSINPNRVLEVIDEGTRRDTKFADSPIRITEDTDRYDGRVVQPDSTQASERRADLTMADAVREVRQDNRTRVQSAGALNELVKQGWEFVDMTGKDRTLKGYLLAPLKPGQDPANRERREIYDPELGRSGPLSARREIPAGLDRIAQGQDYVRQGSEKLYRVGNPQGADYDQIVDDIAERGILPTLTPQPPRPIREPKAQLFPANLDALQNSGGRFGVIDEQGQTRWTNSWQEAAAPGSMFLMQSRNADPVTVFPVAARDGSVQFFQGTPQQSGNLTPAFLSDNEKIRRDAETFGGKDYSLNAILSDITQSAQEKAGNFSESMLGGAGAIGEVLRRNQILVDVAKARAAQSGSPSSAVSPGIDPAALQAALLQSSRNATGREAVVQAIRAGRPGSEYNLFDESNIGDPGLIPGAGGISIWRDGQDVNPVIDRGEGMYATELDDDIAQALQQEAAEQELTLGRDVDTTAPRYDGIQPAYGDFGSVESRSINTQRNAIRPVGTGTGTLVDDAIAYAQALTGGRSPGLAHAIAKTAVENTRATVDGAAPLPRQVFENMEKIANLDPRFVDYALQFANDGDFDRAAKLVEVAQRGTQPGAQGVDPVQVLNAIEQLAGNQVGTGYNSFSRGRQIAYDNLNQAYQQPQYGEIRNYPAYAQALGGELGDSLLDKAMQRAAVRLRDMRAAGAGGY